MQMNEVLNQIRRDIDKCYFALCFEMDSGLPLSISTTEYKDVAESIGAAFGQVLDIVISGQSSARNPAVRAVLKKFKELIIETTKSTFFVMLPPESDSIAVAIGVPREVKLGYARVAIGKHYPQLLSSIQQIS